MNDEERSLFEALKNNVSSNTAKVTIIQLKHNKDIDALSGLVYALIKVIVGIIFVLTIIIFRVFGWSSLNNLLNNIGQLQLWKQLSDNYHILILGFIGAIVAGIIATVIGHFMTDRTKKLVLKLKTEKIQLINS
ncbi:MAG TPA: hypothetical protein VKA08_15855 [Balneolales bacterium]|nr:hypothetical protein [Balneolales bacterium]